ncbi:hypothetical protein ACFVAV_31535 [Nocardia sp. NPDC057663]|uniref:hypothetical protein n=1 Tax=Nocardia sp. NPDC057663 TaxID=3346201 RepID=UPI0036715EBC
MASLSIDQRDRLHRNDVRAYTVGVEEEGPPTGSITDTPRYRRMAERFGALVQQVTCDAR